MGKTPKTIFAKNIVSRRRTMGYRSALAFSEAVKIPYSTIRDIESGASEGRKENKEAIAKFLKCTISDLYRDTQEKPKKSDALKSSNMHDLSELIADNVVSRLEAKKVGRAASVLGVIQMVEGLVSVGTVKPVQASMALYFLSGDEARLKGLPEQLTLQLQALRKSL